MRGYEGDSKQVFISGQIVQDLQIHCHLPVTNMEGDTATRIREGQRVASRQCSNILKHK